jgi:hypothetical protein
MDKIARGFKDKGVVFTILYTREPHAGQKRTGFDFSDKKQTKTHQERVDYAVDMIKKYTEHRPVLIDTFGDDCVQKKYGGSRPNSLFVVDRKGKLALWQSWSNPQELQKKLEEMTGYKLPDKFSTLKDPPSGGPGQRPAKEAPKASDKADSTGEAKKVESDTDKK